MIKIYSCFLYLVLNHSLHGIIGLVTISKYLESKHLNQPLLTFLLIYGTLFSLSLVFFVKVFGRILNQFIIFLENEEFQDQQDQFQQQHKLKKLVFLNDFQLFPRFIQKIGQNYFKKVNSSILSKINNDRYQNIKKKKTMTTSSKVNSIF